MNKFKIKENLKIKINLKTKTIDNNNYYQTKTPSTLKSYNVNNQSNINYLDNFNNKKEFITSNFEDIYELLEKIGQGAHATVYKCIEKSSMKEFAVKITKQHDEELLQSSKIQFQILKQINHKYIIKTQSFYIDKNKMTTYLVCQLCHFSQLATYLRNQKNKNLNVITEAQAISIIVKLLQTLQYLHEKGISHRDIKPENILYDPESKNLKLIDFDCAKIKKQNQTEFQMWTKTGSIHYQAPEYFSQAVYNEKVDIWALGVIAYELITGSLPFKNNYYHRIIKMITQDQINYEGLNISAQFKFLLEQMLEKNVDKRISAADCRRIPLLLKEYRLQIAEEFHQCQKRFKPTFCKFFPDSQDVSDWKSIKYYCFVQI